MARICLIMFYLLAAHSLTKAAETKNPVGDWSGTLQVGQIKLRLLFKLRKTPEGALTGTLDSLDQGAKDILVDDVSLKENKLRLEVKLIQGVYEGTLDESRTKVSWSWKQTEQ